MVSVFLFCWVIFCLRRFLVVFRVRLLDCCCLLEFMNFFIFFIVRMSLFVNWCRREFRIFGSGVFLVIWFNWSKYFWDDFILVSNFCVFCCVLWIVFCVCMMVCIKCMIIFSKVLIDVSVLSMFVMIKFFIDI